MSTTQNTHKEPKDASVGSIQANPLKSNSVSKWLQALELFDSNDPEQALEVFCQITPTNSKIAYNIASIHSILGNYPLAISYFKKATSFDSYMAISHFQIGVSRFLAGSYAKAATSFNTALKLLRGNTVVNYQQLGLDYKLYSCEIVYNRALSYIYSGELSTGIFDLSFAAKEKKYISEHNIIGEALNHFTEMKNSQNQLSDAQKDNGLKLPGTLDIRNQRFSVVNPPKNLQIFSPTQSTPSASSDMFEKASPAAAWKEMAYSLFSVPQGSLFRLTEIKVRSILNDESLSEMMSLGASKNPVVDTFSRYESDSKHSKETSAGKGNALSSSKSKSPPKSSPNTFVNTAQIKGVNAPSNKASTAPGVLTPPISPDFTSTGQKASTTRKSPIKPSVAEGYMELVENTRKLAMGPDSQKVGASNDKDKLAKIQRQVTNDFSRSIPSPAESMTRSSSLGNPLQTPQNHSGTAMSKSYSNSSAHSGHNTRKQTSQRNESKSNTNSGQDQHADMGMHHRSLGANPNLHSQVNNIHGERGMLRSMSSNGYLPSISSNFASSSHYDSPVSSRASLAAPADVSIKIKIFCGNETRAIKIQSGISFNDLRIRIGNKVQRKDVGEDSPILTAISNNLILRIKDEDGDLVLVGDQEDLDVAISEAVTNNRENPKLSVYVENTFEAEI